MLFTMAKYENGPSLVPSPGCNIVLSSHAMNLKDEERQQYISKVSLIGIDPYVIEEDSFGRDLDGYSHLTLINAMVYLIETPSPYTAKNFKNYKSSELTINFPTIGSMMY